MQLYIVTKRFTGGWLKGLVLSEITSVKFETGFRCDKPAGGSPYVVDFVAPLFV